MLETGTKFQRYSIFKNANMFVCWRAGEYFLQQWKITEESETVLLGLFYKNEEYVLNLENMYRSVEKAYNPCVAMNIFSWQQITLCRSLRNKNTIINKYMFHASLLALYFPLNRYFTSIKVFFVVI